MCEWRTIARSPTRPPEAPPTAEESEQARITGRLRFPAGTSAELFSGTADGEEVEGAGEIRLAVALEGEVGRRDGRNEARVEGLRQVQRGMDAVPAGAHRELMEAELAGVEEPEELDAC